MAEVPHLAWPFRLEGRQLAQVEQDSIEDVRQNVVSYLKTERGERPLSPAFGVDDPTFSPGVNGPRLAAEIMRAEDRATVEVRTTAPDYRGRQRVAIAVDLAE
jgi:phage baseplate assembly protein W